MHDMVIFISGKFHIFLGMPMNERFPEVVNIRRVRRKPYNYAHPPNFRYYYPASIWCYCTAVQASIMSGERRKLLRIMEAKQVDFGQDRIAVSPSVEYNFSELYYFKCEVSLKLEYV